MLKISTKGRYALEALTDLALNASDGLENIRNIAARRAISENYLEQIFLSLRKNGIVESIRGPQGGYKLAKAASQITASEILHAVEGQMAPVYCLEEHGEACEKEGFCAAQKVWGKLMNEMEFVLKGVTLAQLVQKTREAQTKNGLDFSI